ncbi:hypothetical protein CIW49_13685 [Mycolicibacterium sp. P1-18]|uniref:hypothetical protein n=1 Tax=Mycolicibacterium sp. P1-18 TaxID=2024615 RepID=UPI0011F2D57B|nr:hypothetical protein [Mycolicibacterium sp. P1-18]KAA0098923.1 hypothetical protein CIW49_13685 [Mycolicibacterium sp. P1-18]
MKNVATTYHIDYTFVSRAEAVEAVTVGTHKEWLAHSDHGPMTVDLRVSSVLDHATEPLVTGNANSRGQPVARRYRAAASSALPTEKETQLRGTPDMRFPIESGALPDMTCGVNGENFVQRFRPTYFTADWRKGFLVQVRIWGPRAFDDGTTGQRHLDHRWKHTPARGPVRYVDLPPQIASRLRAYNAEHGLQGLP